MENLHASRLHQEVKEGLGKKGMRGVIWEAYLVDSPLAIQPLHVTFGVLTDGGAGISYCAKPWLGLTLTMRKRESD